MKAPRLSGAGNVAPWPVAEEFVRGYFELRGSRIARSTLSDPLAGDLFVVRLAGNFAETDRHRELLIRGQISGNGSDGLCSAYEKMLALLFCRRHDQDPGRDGANWPGATLPQTGRKKLRPP